MNETFLFYKTVYDTAQKIAKFNGKEKAYDFLETVIKYGLNSEKPEEDNEIWMFGLDQIFYTIDLAQNRRQQQIETGKLGGRPKKYDDNEIKELYSEYQDIHKVAAAMGCSESTVKRALSS